MEKLNWTGAFMKIILLLLVVFTSQISMANDSCIALTKDKLCIQLDWTQGPFLGAYSENTVKFKDLSLSTSDKEVYRSPKESIQFFGWMKMGGHEHGTRPVETTLDADGVYSNSKIFYMGGMMGTWEFKVKIGTEEFVLHAFDI